MSHELPKNHRSRLHQPPGFKENRSCVSYDAPAWFKVHNTVKTRLTPHDPDNNTNINLYLKTTRDWLEEDGSRKKGLFRPGPRGAEDTAVSEKAPVWMHIRHVPTVDTPVTSFYDPYDERLHEKTVGTTSSQDLPEWAQIKHVPKIAPRIEKKDVRWRPEYQRPSDSIRYDRDSATSREAPDFFHIQGVPRAQLNPYGGYDFDYDHGSFGQKKKNFRQVAATQPNLRRRHGRTATPKIVSRAATANSKFRSRTLSSGNVGRNIAAARKEAEVLKLRRAIKNQKAQNLRLLSEHIAHHEQKLQQRQR